MGILQRIERKLEGAVDDGFARVFGGKVAPQEVENALQREAQDSLEDLGDGGKLAPNAYTLVVSSTDHQEMAAEYELNRKTFSKHLENFIRDNGWQTYGDVVVEFTHSPTLHTGQFRARGTINPDARPGPIPTAGAAPRPPVGGGPQFTPPNAPIPPGPPRAPWPPAQPQPAAPNRNREAGATPMTQNSGYDQRGGYDQGSYPPAPAYGQQPYEPGQEAVDGPAQAYSQQGAYDQGGYASDQQGAYDQGRYAADQRGYDQGYDQQSGYAPDQTAYDQGGYRAGAYEPGYAPEQPGYDQRGYNQGYDQGGYDPNAYQQPGTGNQGGYAPDQGGYQRGYEQPAYQQGGYDQGGYPAEQPGGYAPGYQQGGYDQGGYDNQPGYAPAPGYGAPAGYAPTAITLQLEDGSNRTFQLRNGSNVIGRGQDAQFRLPDTGVSRRHVEIRWDGSSALLNDLNSTNGTTVNDVQVSSWELADGDRIRVGHSDITVRFQ